MLQEENSREDGAEETDRKGAGGRKEKKGLRRIPRLDGELGACAFLLLRACWPHVPQQNAHGTERLDASKRLRPADLTPPSDQRSRCQPPRPTPQRVQGLFKGDCGVTQLFWIGRGRFLLGWLWL